MKRFSAAFMLAASWCVLAWASHIIYNGTLASESGLAYNNTYVLDTQNMGLTSLSMQTVYSSAAFKTASITDGAASTGTITVSSYTALHGTEGTNTLTVVSGKNSNLSSSAATDTVYVASNTAAALGTSYLNVNGLKLLQGRDWYIGNSSSWTALSISSAVSANTGMSAAVSGSTVTITCPAVGLFCNAYTLVSSSTTALVVGKATFSGGQDAAYFTLNGTILTNGTDWFTGAASTNTASSIATAAATINGFTSSVSSNVVTVTCASSGTFCNAYTLTSSTATALSAGAAKFSGGVNSALLSINGIVLKEGVDFTAQTSSAVTATNIATAINANAALSAIVVATASACPGCGVVLTTATAVGTGTNYSLWTSTYAALKPATAGMRGGSASSFVTGSKAISIANHGYTRALGIVYTKTSGTNPANLVTATTYYVIPLTASTFQLSTTSTGAVAGTPIVNISSQAAAGGGAFTLTPVVYVGTASWRWQISNDNVNWSDLTTTATGVTISSVTYGSPSATPVTTQWDFGNISYRYIRLNVIAPLQGGLTLIVTGVGKGDYR